MKAKNKRYTLNVVPRENPSLLIKGLSWKAPKLG